MDNQEGSGAGREEGGGGVVGAEVEVDETDQMSSISSRDRPVQVHSVSNDNRRIGPWHAPDLNRQRVLADRLANPALRSSRPATRLTVDRNPYDSPPSSSSSASALARSPYRHRTTGNSNSRMNSAPTSGSPRRDTGSPKRQLSTPRYGAVSPRRQPPLYPNSANSRRVTDDELDSIISRVTRPTVSSRGGVDLLDKDFTYIQPRRLKTLPVVPGLERRYLGLQSVDSARMDDIVGRLTRMTSAYTAKFAINKNVWVDREPGAHMVQRGHVQSV